MSDDPELCHVVGCDKLRYTKSKTRLCYKHLMIYYKGGLDMLPNEEHLAKLRATGQRYTSWANPQL